MLRGRIRANYYFQPEPIPLESPNDMLEDYSLMQMSPNSPLFAL